MLEQTLACCLYAPGSYDSLLPGLDLDGAISDLRDAIVETRGQRRNEFDQVTIVRWIHQHSAGGMTTEHTIALVTLTESWWAMPESMRARARDLSQKTSHPL
jgi:hypothetical protein